MNSNDENELHFQNDRLLIQLDFICDLLEALPADAQEVHTFLEAAYEKVSAQFDANFAAM